MDRIVRNPRRFTNFVQSLFTSMPAGNVQKQYVRVTEETGNYIILDKDDIMSAVVEENATTIIPWGMQEDDEKIIGTILNPEVLTAGLQAVDGRYEYKDTATKDKINAKEVAAVRVRPLGQGDFIADRRFVELQFKGGGFLRAIAATDEAKKLEALITQSNAPIIEWKAGTHDIWIRRDQLSGCEIDKHEPEYETQVRSHSSSEEDQLNVRMVTSEGQTTDVLLSTPPIPGRNERSFGGGNFGRKRFDNRRPHGGGGGGGGGGYDNNYYAGSDNRKYDRWSNRPNY